MRKIITNTLIVLAVLALLDMMILFAALGQISMENKTGYWAPFWRVQAEFVVNILR